MKHIYYIMVLGMLCMLTACEDDNDSHLTTSITEITLPPEGGSQIVTINCNTDWHVVTSADWVSVYPSTGSMSKDVTITATPNDNTLEQETRIVVSTNDGRKLVNITVTTASSSGISGKYIDLKSEKRVFNGKAGSTDSLEITANVNWEVLGPEWIEVWDGARWRPLSTERGIIRGGSGQSKVLMRTVADNKDDSSLADVITVKEYLTGNYSRSVNVQQLGRLEVSPYLPWTLENGVVIGWRCGCDVATIYYYITDELEDQNTSVTPDDVHSKYKKTSVEYLDGITGLEPGIQYRLTRMGEDAQGNLSKRYTTGTFVTESETDAMVDIAKGEYLGNGQWNLFVNMGYYTDYYRIYATDNPNSAFMYNDPILWYIAQINFNKNQWYSAARYNSTGWIEWDNLSVTTDEIHVMALAANWNGVSRKKVFRYDRFFDSNSRLLPEKALLDRIPVSMIYDPSLR